MCHGRAGATALLFIFQMQVRPAVKRSRDTRVFVDDALAELRASRWRPAAWATFVRRCGARSAKQARSHPRAAVEVTVVHLAMLPIARRSPVSLTASWVLAMTHLGLLGTKTGSIGPANVVSMLRANLPARRWGPALAVASDAADGWLARRTAPTAFGAYADPLADVTFWMRHVWAREASFKLRATATGLWLLPLVAIAAAYFVGGGTVDYPRPLAARRLSACLQLLLALRGLKG